MKQCCVMGTVRMKAVVMLFLSIIIYPSSALLKPRPPNPGGSELLPETKKFLEKLEKATSVQDIKKIQEEDDTFMVHDFRDNLDSEKLKPKTDGESGMSCDTAANEPEKPPLLEGESTEHTSESVHGVTEPVSSDESKHEPSNDIDNESDGVQQETAVPDMNSTEADVGDKTADTEEIFELVDFGKSKDVTEPSGVGMSGYETLRHDHRSLASSIERLRQDPPPEQPSDGDAKDPKKKKKKQTPEPEPPTKEELEATYKYEVLAPPDSSPVKLDFPASPHAQGEEHLSQHVPLPLYCDTCQAVAFQLHLAFDKFHSQVRRRPPTESEVYHIVSGACQPSRYNEYGMLEVHGHRHISGPGISQLEAEGGVKHSRGPWPRRLAERCEEITEDVGELAMHQAWMREQRDPERFRMFMCFGDPPRNYCQKYGHMDAAAEAEARRSSRPPEVKETPIEAASRLAREAKQAELRRLEAEQAELRRLEAEQAELRRLEAEQGDSERHTDDEQAREEL